LKDYLRWSLQSSALKINKRKRRSLKNKNKLFLSSGLSAMVLTKLRFENQQKKTPQLKK
jgi:hypothetical protein